MKENGKPAQPLSVKEIYKTTTPLSPSNGIMQKRYKAEAAATENGKMPLTLYDEYAKFCAETASLAEEEMAVSQASSQSASNTQEMIPVASQPKEQPMSLDSDVGGIVTDAYISGPIKRRRNEQPLNTDQWIPEVSSIRMELEKLKIKKQAEIDIKRLENEGKKLENEGKKLENEGKKIELEKLRELRQTEQIKLDMIKLEMLKAQSKM